MNVCRIEDTDQARSTKESELEVMADLAWLGINWQEGAAAVPTRCPISMTRLLQDDCKACPA